MPRPIWTGSISFGLVSVPVKLFSAVQQQDVRFHQLERGTGERIRMKRTAEGSGKDVAYEDIDKGYEVSKGEYVIVTSEELEAVEPGKSRAIDIEDFVDLDDIDPVYFENTYLLAPADEAAARPYTVLQAAMERSGRAAVARFVMRTKQHLAVIRPADARLILETLYFADEVRLAEDIREFEHLDAVSTASDRELKMADQLLESLVTDWDPTRYEDTYRTRVLELIESKAKGDAIVTEREDEPAQVIDLMAALEASVKRAKEGRAGLVTDEVTETGGDGAGAAGEYASMSKDELYEEAQRLEIPGRSKMGKDELVEALGAASAPKKKRRKAS
ncbi:MAG: Ku protein [Acidimicrobiia bacterium]|nr:Ku protein [Acidimicrobiia bacterium]